MIDKLKKIAELAPELLNLKFEAPYPDCEEEVILLDYPVDDAKLSENDDLAWILVGKLIDDLQKRYKDKGYAVAIEIDSDNNASFAIGYSGTKYADTLLEVVCDAWLSVNGGGR